MLFRSNTGAAYGRGAEWNATGVGTLGTTTGYPNNVQISTAGTNLDENNSSNTARALAGNLTIDASTTLSMGTSTASLTVGGNVVLNGTLTLSSASGGDINVGGNWTSTGTFTPNTRAVTFNAASGNQTITKSGGETFDYVIINKAAGNVVLANAITVNQTLTFTSGKLSLGANNLTFGSSGTTASASSSNYILAGSTGKVLKTYSTGSFTYPIGASATQYCPVTITNTGGVSQTYTVGVVTPTTYSPSTDAVNFDWSIGSTGSSASTLEFSWFTADASGSLASTPANGVAFQ
mgnify:CR=1 FL=1